jgi:hypothetical protein
MGTIGARPFRKTTTSSPRLNSGAPTVTRRYRPNWPFGTRKTTTVPTSPLNDCVTVTVTTLSMAWRSPVDCARTSVTLPCTMSCDSLTISAKSAGSTTVAEAPPAQASSPVPTRQAVRARFLRNTRSVIMVSTS